jgi:hypothetical protein
MNKTKKPGLETKGAKYSQVENISILGIVAPMAALSLHLYATAYLDAARSLPLTTVRFEPVRSFLICHSIELALKAYLSIQGTKMIDMAGGAYGHNLDSILNAADEKNLVSLVNLTEIRRAEIRQASIYYAGKVFEYPAVGESLSAYPHKPRLNIIDEAAYILVSSLRQACIDAQSVEIPSSTIRVTCG